MKIVQGICHQKSSCNLHVLGIPTTLRPGIAQAHLRLTPYFFIGHMAEYVQLISHYEEAWHESAIIPEAACAFTSDLTRISQES